MAASTFEKIMRNRTLSANSRAPAISTRDARESWTLNVAVDPADGNLIRSFFIAEQVYYNTLVNGFNARLRSFPESLLAMSGPWEELFADLAMHSVHPRRLTADNFPEALQKHRTMFVDDKGRTKPLSERTSMILELAAAGGSFHPKARRAMAMEMIRFYRQQAQTSTASVPVGLREEQTFRTAPESLEPIERKRHVQLPRNAVVATYDTALQETRFLIPYAKKPIVVHGDFSPATSWNLMVLRQTGAANAAPWQLELRKTSAHYLLKMFDSLHRPKRYK